MACCPSLFSCAAWQTPLLGVPQLHDFTPKSVLHSLKPPVVDSRQSEPSDAMPTALTPTAVLHSLKPLSSGVEPLSSGGRFLEL